MDPGKADTSKADSGKADSGKANSDKAEPKKQDKITKPKTTRAKKKEELKRVAEQKKSLEDNLTKLQKEIEAQSKGGDAEAKLSKQIEDERNALAAAQKEEEEIEQLDVMDIEKEPLVDADGKPLPPTNSDDVVESMEGIDTTPAVHFHPPGREEDAGILQTAEEAEQRAEEGLNRKIVRVKKGPRGNPECIAQYGPYNSAKYRTEPISKDVLIDPRNEHINISKPSKRIGEMKIDQDGGEVFKYGRANVKAILGVVLPQTNANENILDKVDPSKKGKRFCPITVKISWDEKVQQAEGTYISFETRSVYKRLWRGISDKAKDEKIFEIAKMQEDRYKRWEQGQRRGTESSPSAAPEQRQPSKTPAPQDTANTPQPAADAASTPQPTAAVKTESPPAPQTRSKTAQGQAQAAGGEKAQGGSSSAIPQKNVKQWLNDYALVSGWDPTNLTTDQKKEAASQIPPEVSRS